MLRRNGASEKSVESVGMKGERSMAKRISL